MKKKNSKKGKEMSDCGPGCGSCCGGWSFGSKKKGSDTFGCGYFLGFLGAAVYYVSGATGFWNGVLGLLKALVWPAFVVFELMKFLGM